MKKRNRIIAAIGLAALWAICITTLRALLAPTVGAVVVNQIDASNAGYFALAATISAVSIATILISLLFAVVIVVVLRSK
jgi:hypothetical protein